MTHESIHLLKIKEKFKYIRPLLNERSIRAWCAAEALSIGRGGLSLVHAATGISRPTITKGIKDIKSPATLEASRVRASGGGRKKLIEKDVTLLLDLDRLIEPVTRGDPESLLRWTSKSTTKLTEELNKAGHQITQRTVHRELVKQKYSMKSNRKRHEGAKENPDRDAQFQLINQKTLEFQSRKCPVLSVDTKKKENIGNFKNNGKEWSRKGEHVDVNVYDFIDKEKGKAAPYGIYDITTNKGWVSIGISSDTAEFAVESIRNWWKEMGEFEYKDASEIMITADCGGSNGYRVRLWKYELQKLANELNKSITVCHFPQGTSKWNKIEHRMFCHITQNWRARPLVDLQTIVELIGNTTTKTGLKIKTMVDPRVYQKGIQITDEEFAFVRLKPMDFHPEWNYTIVPKNVDM